MLVDSPAMATAQETPRAGTPEVDAEREVDFADVGRRILRRWWVVLAATVLGAMIGYLT